MKRSRKTPIIIGTIGDCNPFKYSGGVILDHGDNHPTLIWFEAVDADNDTEATCCYTYHVALDRRQLLGDVDCQEDVYTLSHYSNQIPWSELAHGSFGPYASTKGLSGVSDFGYAFGGCPYAPSQYTEWWDKDYQAMADSAGIPIEQLREAECSSNPVRLADFYSVVAGYYGWNELTGGEVQTERIADLRKRWALRFYQARKRGIRVYA